MSVALIGCVKSKRTGWKASGNYCIARSLYDPSPLFRKIVRYVESCPDKYKDWFILSALYGLVAKDQTIEPYELTLSTFSQEQLKVWSRKIFLSLQEQRIADVSFFCGSNYCNSYLLMLLDRHGIKYDLPMDGLSLGRRLSFLNKKSKIFLA